MGYRPLWQSRISDARGRGLVLAVDGEFERIWSASGASWTDVSSDYLATAWDNLLINASSNNVTVTLPSSPSTGDIVRLADAYGKATTNTITISRNENNIMSIADDLVVDIDYAIFGLSYANATVGWLLLNIQGVVL